MSARWTRSERSEATARVDDRGAEQFSTVLADRRTNRRDDEDAAAVIAVLAALTGGSASDRADPPRDLWGSPTRRLGIADPGPHSWWASGQPT